MGIKAYALVGFCIISLMFTQYAFAEQAITVSLDRSSYDAGDIIQVSGKVVEKLSYAAVAISIISPLGDVVGIAQVDIGYDNTFSTEFTAGGLQWEYDGIYTIKVVYGGPNRTAETTFNFDTGALIFVYTDRSSYNDGDTIRISGDIQNLSDIAKPVSLWIVDPAGETVVVAQVYPSSDRSFSHTVISGGTMQISGNYEVIVTQGFGKSATTFYFVGTTTDSCGPDEVRDVTGECVYAFDDYDPPNILSVETDRSSYNDGDTIRISGNAGDPNAYSLVAVTMFMFDPIGETMSVAQVIPSTDGSFHFTVKAGGIMQISGDYTITAQYGSKKSTTTFSFSAGGTIPTPTPFDTTPPLILTPSDMTIDATDSSGARVNYSVKAIDDNDGVVKPRCSPSSGSLFKIGNTGVTCLATDYSGNSARKSFLITVNSPDVVIPSWVRDVAGFWCGDEIDDISFIEAIQYLIDNDVIIVPTTASSGSGAQEIPNWIKNNACWWAQGLISNSDFAGGLQYLIGQGIIRV